MPVWSKAESRNPVGFLQRGPVENLLGKQNPARTRTRTSQELTPEQRSAQGLVTHDETKFIGSLQGDPYGQKLQDSGNIFHHQDPRAEEILQSTFEALNSLTLNTGPELERLTAFFELVPGSTHIVEVALKVANTRTLHIPAGDVHETNIQFVLGCKTVHLRQCHELDLSKSNTRQFQDSPKARYIWASVKAAAEKTPMDRFLLRYLVAMRLCQRYKYPAHKVGDKDNPYRDATEVDFWIQTIGLPAVTRDAVRELAHRLVDQPETFADEQTRSAFPPRFFEHSRTASDFVSRNETWLGSIEDSGAGTADKRHLDMF